MDTIIVNRILCLCSQQETCSFELSYLNDYFRNENICSNAKYILASIKNYLEIFRINREQNRIELSMPFEICRNDSCTNCSNLHVCYDYFTINSCQQGSNCRFEHVLNEDSHRELLGILVNLDLQILTKAFRVYCQFNVNKKKDFIALLNGNSSWRSNNQQLKPKATTLTEKGIQICWHPEHDIEPHFIEVIFSNQIKSHGGPFRTHQISQHLGVAQVFYQNSDSTIQVVNHGSVTFQSFTFIPRLLQRTMDRRHVCLTNLPDESNSIESYIDRICKPYEKLRFDFYENDSQMIIIEFNEDIDFSRISFNIRQNPEYNGQIIHCLPLYLPQVLLVEHSPHISDDDIRQLFDSKQIFHMKSYSICTFVHFYSHDEIQRAMKQQFEKDIRLVPIYFEIYSLNHLKNYLQKREIELSSKSIEPEIPSDSDGDDFHDLSSNFDENDVCLNENLNDNDEMEFLRNTTKSLMTSLNQMEQASADVAANDAPNSLLYGDDFLITIKSRRFSIAFLDYTQFRVEKQRHPERFRLLKSLKKFKDTEKHNEIASLPANDETTSTQKKKRNKRNKRKKSTNNDDENHLSD